MEKIIIITLIIFIQIPCSAFIVEQLGLYDTYQLAPDVGKTKVNPPGSQVVKVDRNKGYYVDGRNQVPEYSRIPPPNPDKIPKDPHPTRTVEPFESYYDRNVAGIRRHPYMTPVIPNYNRHYSERRARPYTKEEYVDVWCSGKKYVNGCDCQSENYSIYFYAVRNWPIAVIRAPWKAKKTGKKAAIFFWVDDLGLDAPQMHDAKEWGELFNMPMFFGTIDSYIPGDWII